MAARKPALKAVPKPEAPTTSVTLQGVGMERAARNSPRWVAYWTMTRGTSRFAMHQTLPLTVRDTTEAEAEKYARANPDRWVQGFMPATR